jgi:hypothetical protein
MSTKRTSIGTIARRLCPCTILLAFATVASFAETINVSGGGTLTFTLKTVEYECQIGPPSSAHRTPPANEEPYYISTFSGFSYTLSGVTTPLAGELQQTIGPGANGTICPAKSYPSQTWYIAPGFPFSSQNIVTFATSSTFVGEGSANLSHATPGLLYPAYQVDSIIYDTPGNYSTNGFQNTETDGTTVTVGNSFTSSTTTTYSVTFGFLFGSSTLSWDYGNSTTNGNATAVTATVSEGSGVLSASNHGSPNTLNHNQDLFIIWLNPAVVAYQTGVNSLGYAEGTQLQTAGDPDPGQSEVQDQVEVVAQVMMANAQGATAVPAAILNHQIVDIDGGTESLPGLAAICANLKVSEYNSNTCTLADQCGCVPSDFAPILAQDPLLNYSATEDPLNADTSGATACENPTSADSCRYVPMNTPELLSGPDCQGCIQPENPFQECDSNQTAKTLSQSDSFTEGFSWEQKWTLYPTTSGIGLKQSNQWTWTNSESVGKINSNAHCMSVNLSSSTVGCNEDVTIYEDTVYHTFVFQQPSGNNSCP